MNDIDKSSESETENKDSRLSVIKEVQTPLGFFVLVVLIVEVILGLTANTSSGADRTYLIIGMLGLIFLLVLLVSGMAIFRPASLYGRGLRSKSGPKQDPINLSALQNPKEHQVSVLSGLKNVQHSLYETAINQPRTPPSELLNLESYFSTGQTEYKRLLYKRLAKREIRYANVRVIPYKQRFEYVVFLALLHEGLPYFLRYYDFPKTKIPLFDIVSLDNNEFYLGGFYSIDDSIDAKVLVTHDSNLNVVLKDYWQILWQNSIPIVDDRESIRWDELKRLGTQFGIQEREFDELISKLREQVRKAKKQAKLT